MGSPGGREHIDGEAQLRGTTKGDFGKLVVRANAAIAARKIVSVVGAGLTDADSPLQVTLASQAALLTARGPLFVTRFASNASGDAIQVYSRVRMDGLDTSLGAVGDPVYLSTAGGATLTAPTTGVVRVVGRVYRVASSGFTWLFDPAGEDGSIPGSSPNAQAQATGVLVMYASGLVIVEFTSQVGTANYTATLQTKCRLIGVSSYMIGAGAAGDTAVLKNGASAITDTHDLSALADQDRWEFDTINDANIDIAAGGTLVLTTASDALTKVIATLMQVA
jgi:hypothetical protein